MELKNLFSPITLDKLELRNRIVLAPMGIGAYSDDETVPDEYVSFIADRVRDTGLVISTGVRVSAKYSSTNFMGCYDDSQIPGLRKLSHVAHRAGAKIFLQMLELGGADEASAYVPSVAAPPYREDWKGENPPVELKTAQIRDIRDSFIHAARRAQEAGFDGVELDGAENFLISDFICPGLNLRTDDYGGSFENRMRLPVEVVQGIRRVCGSDFPVGFKFNAFYDLPDGIDLKLGVKIARRMARAGVCYIHEWSFAKLDKPMSLFKYPPMPNLYQPRNTTVSIAENLKLHLPSVPVIAVGGIGRPEEADRMIGDGKTDMVALGRAFIADQQWAYKAKRGLRIRPCIRCHVCHHEVAEEDNLVVCSVNPDVLGLKKLKKTKSPVDVMVVGAGPGGITAALAASERGHGVWLYEKDPVIGGKLIAGSAPGFKIEYGDYLQYLRDEIGQSRVKLVLNKAVTPEYVIEKSPDSLVVAIGAEPVDPRIGDVTQNTILYAADALKGAGELRGKRIAVIGGGDVGCETALLLSQMGNEVSIIEALPSLMENEEIRYNAVVLEDMLHREGIRLYTSSTVTRIEGHSIRIDTKGNGEKNLRADIIVISTGWRPTPDIVKDLKTACTNSHAIGDCVNPRKLRQAIGEGYSIGCTL
jgi:2,4-dienoyl-CoA reductase-like NADH-dependent reductase (Old Yellow Enzyme family)/thioredoxin reductase